MKNKGIWLLLSFLLVAAMLLASCAKSTTKPTPMSTTITTKTTTTQTTKTTATTVTAPTTTATTTATGNWWDKFGTPKYGGDLVIRTNKDIVAFDENCPTGTMNILPAWTDRLYVDNWTLDPAIFSFNIAWRPNDYIAGGLASSWEFTDPGTYVVHLRQGIHWQNTPPANGREFVASDVVFHYDRLFGLGVMKISPYYTTDAAYTQNLTSVVATDKYTVVFKWTTPNQEFVLETLEALGNEGMIEDNPEAIQAWGDLNDWHHAIGTGPFILTDFVSGSSATLIKNPNYWGHDERYPQNQLPYVDTLKVLIIPDDATALAALRTGKIDAIAGVSLQTAQTFQKTNPEIMQVSTPVSNSYTVDPRNDVIPLKDIRVREAMQKSIDLPTIANTYYQGTCSPNPSGLTSVYETGWGWPYDQWPQDLKDEYAYNPTAAKQLLAAAGYATGFNTDMVTDASADLNLMQIVKSYFAAVGINMEIRVMDSASWTSFVRTSHKQDQLAESSTGQLGFSFEPLRQLQRFVTGYAANYVIVNDPVFNAFYNKALAATNIGDIKQVVRDANEYVVRQHFIISLLDPNVYGLCQPWLKGYNGQTESVTGTTTGPLQLGFYTSRFWIDENLKKSMGH